MHYKLIFFCFRKWHDLDASPLTQYKSSTGGQFGSELVPLRAEFGRFLSSLVRFWMISKSITPTQDPRIDPDCVVLTLEPSPPAS